MHWFRHLSKCQSIKPQLVPKSYNHPSSYKSCIFMSSLIHFLTHTVTIYCTCMYSVHVIGLTTRPRTPYPTFICYCHGFLTSPLIRQDEGDQANGLMRLPRTQWIWTTGRSCLYKASMNFLVIHEWWAERLLKWHLHQISQPNCSTIQLKVKMMVKKNLHQIKVTHQHWTLS